MPSFRRLLAAGAALVLTGPVMPAPDAYYVGANSGRGTIRPGLTMVPAYQWVTWTFDFLTLVGDDGSVVVATGCVFDGASTTAETLFAGRGAGVLGGCVGANVYGELQYLRQGVVMTFSGSVTVNGRTQRRAMSMHCAFAPHDTNATSYSAHCEWS